MYPSRKRVRRSKRAAEREASNSSEEGGHALREMAEINTLKERCRKIAEENRMAERGRANLSTLVQARSGCSLCGGRRTSCQRCQGGRIYRHSCSRSHSHSPSPPQAGWVGGQSHIHYVQHSPPQQQIVVHRQCHSPHEMRLGATGHTHAINSDWLTAKRKAAINYSTNFVRSAHSEFNSRGGQIRRYEDGAGRVRGQDGDLRNQQRTGGYRGSSQRGIGQGFAGADGGIDARRLGPDGRGLDGSLGMAGRLGQEGRKSYGGRQDNGYDNGRGDIGVDGYDGRRGDRGEGYDDGLGRRRADGSQDGGRGKVDGVDGSFKRQNEGQGDRQNENRGIEGQRQNGSGNDGAIGIGAKDQIGEDEAGRADGQRGGSPGEMQRGRGSDLGDKTRGNKRDGQNYDRFGYDGYLSDGQMPYVAQVGDTRKAASPDAGWGQGRRPELNQNRGQFKPGYQKLDLLYSLGPGYGKGTAGFGSKGLYNGIDMGAKGQGIIGPDGQLKQGPLGGLLGAGTQPLLSVQKNNFYGAKGGAGLGGLNQFGQPTLGGNTLVNPYVSGLASGMPAGFGMLNQLGSGGSGTSGVSSPLNAGYSGMSNMNPLGQNGMVAGTMNLNALGGLGTMGMGAYSPLNPNGLAASLGPAQLNMGAGMLNQGYAMGTSGQLVGPNGGLLYPIGQGQGDSSGFNLAAGAFINQGANQDGRRANRPSLNLKTSDYPLDKDEGFKKKNKRSGARSESSDEGDRVVRKGKLRNGDGQQDVFFEQVLSESEGERSEPGRSRRRRRVSRSKGRGKGKRKDQKAESEYLREIKSLLLEGKQKQDTEVHGSTQQQSYVRQLEIALSRKDGSLQVNQREIEMLNGTVGKLRQRVSELQANNLELDRKNQMLNEELDRFRRSEKAFRRDEERRVSIVRQSFVGSPKDQEEKLQIAGLKDRLKELEGLLQNRDKLVSSEEERYSREEVKRTAGRGKELQSQLRKLQSELARMSSQNQEMRREIKAKEQQYEVPRERQSMRLLGEGDGRRQAALQRQLQEKSRELKSAEKEVGSLRHEMMTLTFNLKMKDGEIESVKGALQQVKQQLDREKAEARQREGEHEGRLRQLEHDLRRKGEEVKRAYEKAELAGEERMNRTKSRVIEESRPPRSDLFESELRGLKEQLREKEQRLKEKEEAELRLVLELKEKESELKMNSRMKELEGKHNQEALLELQRVKRSCDELKGKLDDQRKKAMALAADKDRLESSLRVVERERESDRGKGRDTTEEESLQSKISVLSEESQRMRRQLQKEKKENERLREQLAESRQRAEQLGREVQSLKERLSEYKEGLEEAEKNSRELQERLRKYHLMMEDKNRINDGLTIDLEIKDGANRTLQNQLKNVIREKQQLERKAIQAREELAYLNRRLADLERQLQDKGDKNAQLNEQNGELSKALEGCRAERLRLELEYGLHRAKQEHQIQRLTDRIRELERQARLTLEQEEKLRRLQLLEMDFARLQEALQEKDNALAELEERGESDDSSNGRAGKGRGRLSINADLKLALEQNLKCQEQIRGLLSMNKNLELQLQEDSERHEREMACLEESESALRCRLQELQSVSSCTICRANSCAATARQQDYSTSAIEYEKEVELLRANLSARMASSQQLSEELYRSRLESNHLRDSLEVRESELIAMGRLVEAREQQLHRLTLHFQSEIYQLQSLLEGPERNSQAVLQRLSEEIQHLTAGRERIRGKLILRLEEADSPLLQRGSLREFDLEQLIDSLLALQPVKYQIKGSESKDRLQQESVAGGAEGSVIQRVVGGGSLSSSEIRVEKVSTGGRVVQLQQSPDWEQSREVRGGGGQQEHEILLYREGGQTVLQSEVQYSEGSPARVTIQEQEQSE